MNQIKHWISCDSCRGQGKKSYGLSKKALQNYLMECEEFEKSKALGSKPIRPKAEHQICKKCSGIGIISTEKTPISDDEKYPNIAIIGGGIGGVALALACLHRQIPFTLFERDSSFEDRSQGYGLTLQQASKAMKQLGILSLKEGIVSTKHIVHNPEGKILGEWGNRKWIDSNLKKESKHRNIHITRQSLRLELLNQLGKKNIQWNHQLINFKTSDEGVKLQFNVNGITQYFKADLVVGADGIRSAVRKLVIPEEKSPLNYLGCIVILGICQLDQLNDIKSDLLDGETVFQTANGNERIYMMPYNKNAVMWQLSFPMSEEDAKKLSAKGADALKAEACRRTQWHDPIPQILAATNATAISGYPVYDREVLDSNLLKNAGSITLIGDAAHPMSPFKGQGANQALLDALQLARKITSVCNASAKNGRSMNLRETILTDFESEMIARSSVKVQDSAAAAKFLHSEIVLKEGDETIGAKWLSTL